MNPPPDSRLGSELLGYRIETLLGRSRMSVVYRAEHLRLKRKVAVKFLAPELAGDVGFRKRFLRESEHAASLDHPHIVPVYDAGEYAGELYIVMRYVPGGDLRTLVREGGPLKPVRALALLGQVAEALDAAHEAGLLHRDVKPGNVLLDSRDYGYLSDFGLAQAGSSKSGLTISGEIVGTVAYVAPEVIKGGEITPRADLYSLGCLLFECLTGEPPFRHESEFAVLWAHVNEAPPKLSSRCPELAGELDVVVAKALSKAPEERYATGRDFIEAANRALPEPLARFPVSRRRRVVLGLGVLVAAAAIVVALALVGRGDDGPSVRPTLTPSVDSIQRIDPKTNTVVATIPVPVEASLLTAGGGAIWAASSNRNRLFRIDPNTNAVVQTISTIDPRGMGFGAGFLWVLDGGGGIVTKFDPRSGVPVSTHVLPPGSLLDTPAPVRVSADDVWVQWAMPTGNAVRIDTQTGVARAVTVGPKSVPVVFDFAPFGSLLWAVVPNPQKPGSMALIRTHPGEPSSSVRVPGSFDGYIVADRTGVWGGDSFADRVVHVGEGNRRFDRYIPVGDFPSGIALGHGAVWVTNRHSGTVSRIDATTRRVVATILVGPSPGGVTVGGGSVWVDVHPS